MAVKTETVITYECDRCKHVSNNELARGGAATLHLNATYVGFGGDVGGGTVKLWLCGKCLTEFNEWQKAGKN